MNRLKIKNLSLLYYDNSHKEHTQQLIRESSFVTEHIVRRLQAHSFFNCGRINFICCTDQTRYGVREAYGICEMDISFDPMYFSFSIEEKTHYLFDLLYSSIKDLCDLKQWDFTLFQNAFKELKSNNYTSCFYTKLSVKRKGNCARVLGMQKLDSLSFYLEYSSTKNRKELFHLFDSKQSCFDYDRFLGKLFWKGENEIVLLDKDNVEIDVIDIRIMNN